MGYRVEAAPQLLVEASPAPTIWVSGVARIDLLGDGAYCITLQQEVPNAEGSMEQQVALRLIMSGQAIEAAIGMWVRMACRKMLDVLKRAN